MILSLHRQSSNESATLGRLFVNDDFECVTLEDVVRCIADDGSGKVQDATAIPAGTYPVIINMSPRLGRPMMRLLDVPHFDGILIHSGNDDVDTHGCILVGQVVDGPDHIHGGSLALPMLQAQVANALAAGEDVSIVITDDFLLA
jgi:hypothetical protein